MHRKREVSTGKYGKSDDLEKSFFENAME